MKWKIVRAEMFVSKFHEDQQKVKLPWFYINYYHGFKNRIGPAGSTVNRYCIRSGSLKKSEI